MYARILQDVNVEDVTNMKDVKKIKPWAVRFENGERRMYTLEQLRAKFGAGVCFKSGTAVTHERRGAGVVEEAQEAQGSPASQEVCNSGVGCL